MMWHSTCEAGAREGREPGPWAYAAPRLDWEARLDVVIVLEAVDQMHEELKQLEPVGAAVQQRVHRLKGGLAQLEPIVDRVLERAEVDLVHELRLLARLLVQHGQQLRQVVAHRRGLVVRDAVERQQRAATHLDRRGEGGGA